MAQIIFKNKCLVLYATPKCGITSAQRTIHLNWELLNNLTESVGNYIIVRNPWTRVASFYVDMFVQRHVIFIKEQLSQLNLVEKPFQKFLRKLLIKKDISNMTFLEFVHIVAEIDDNSIERHLKSQNYYVKNVQFDGVLKLEQINRDIKRIHPKLEFEHENDSSSPIT